jgi:hypothetical protein
VPAYKTCSRHADLPLLLQLHTGRKAEIEEGMTEGGTEEWGDGGRGTEGEGEERRERGREIGERRERGRFSSNRPVKKLTKYVHAHHLLLRNIYIFRIYIYIYIYI